MSSPARMGLCDRHMVKVSYVERAERFDTALSAAESGIDADRVLTGMLSDPALDMRERKLVVAALGRTRGPEGLAAARRTFSTAWENYPRASKSARAGERDLICACASVLAERDGPAATELLTAKPLPVPVALGETTLEPCTRLKVGLFRCDSRPNVRE
jgi:hypothetical protein